MSPFPSFGENQTVGQPGYSTTNGGVALTNEALWTNYGLAAAGEVMDPAATAEPLTEWRIVGGRSSSPVPRIGTLEESQTLPTDDARLGLVTPWNGAELIVPASESSTLAWIRVQMNGGLKFSGNDPLERFDLTITDLTESTEFLTTHALSRTIYLYPWHTYEVVAKIVDIDNDAIVYASRTATFSVVQPHITEVHVGQDGASINIPLGSNNQLRSIDSSYINTVSITFNQDMNRSDTRAHIMQPHDLRVVPIGGGAVVTATSLTAGASHVYTWTLPSSLAKGQYYLELSNAIVDENLHPLTNGWTNPASITDVHPGVGQVSLNGFHASQFALAVNILPGDSDQNNVHGSDHFEALPTNAPALSSIVDIAWGNSAASSGYLRRYEVQVGSTAQTAVVVPILADTIYVQFSQPMRLDGTNKLQDGSLSLTALDGYPPTVVANSFHWDWKTNTASWRLEPPTDGDHAGIIAGDFTILVSGTVVDVNGVALDGNWTNNVSTVSGDGTAGDQFSFHVLLLPYDLNSSKTVDFAELNTILTYYGLPGTFWQGDFNEDGTVNFTDLNILLSWYGITIL